MIVDGNTLGTFSVTVLSVSPSTQGSTKARLRGNSSSPSVAVVTSFSTTSGPAPSLIVSTGCSGNQRKGEQETCVV